MAGWAILSDINGDPVLPTGAAMSGRRLLVKEGPDVSHPARSISVGANAFAKAYSRTVEAVCELRKIGVERSNAVEEVRTGFENLCYRAAEYLEAYEKLPRALSALDAPPYREEFKKFRKIFNGCSRDWSLICNRMKHNQNALAIAVFYYPSLSATLEVFTLLQPNGADELKINENLHKSRSRSMPFTIALRQMLHDIVRVDRSAAKVLEMLPEDPTAAAFPATPMALSVGEAMKEIERWPFWSPADGSSMVDTFVRSGSGFESKRMNVTKRREAATVKFSIIGDGITRTFPIV